MNHFLLLVIIADTGLDFLLNKTRISSQECQLACIQNLFLLFYFCLELNKTFPVQRYEPRILSRESFSLLTYVKEFSMDRLFKIGNLLHDLIQSLFKVSFKSIDSFLYMSLYPSIIKLIFSNLLVLQLLDSSTHAVSLACPLFFLKIVILLYISQSLLHLFVIIL